MSLKTIRKLSIVQSMKEDRDLLVSHLENNNINEARQAMYRLLESVAVPKGAAKGFLMFKHKHLTLEELALQLNALEPKYKEQLFSHESAVVTEDKLQSSLILNQLAFAVQDSQYKDLLDSRRSEGFAHFIADLEDERYNQTNPTWTLTKGKLLVDKAHLADATTIKEIHEFLGRQDVFGGKPWYQTPTTENDLGLYDVKFKTLGQKNNKAVDPVFILRGADGRLKVLCGKRFDGSYAFPGGMNESNVIQTCIDELLEECFSGNLFSQGSGTATLINALDGASDTVNQIISENFLRSLQTHRKPKEGSADYVKSMSAYLSEEKSLQQKLTSILEAIKPQKTTAKYIQAVVEAIRRSDIDEGKIEPLVAHIKCDIYKQCLPEQYAQFEQFIKAKMHKEPLVINKSDPRNTDLGAMYTNPLEAILDEEELTTTLKEQCALDFGGGDDLGDVKYRPIEVFAEKAYSDHASLLVHAVNRGIQRGDIALTKTISSQLLDIAKHYHCQKMVETFTEEVTPNIVAAPV